MLPFNTETMQVFELLRIKNFERMSVLGKFEDLTRRDIVYLKLNCNFSPNFKDLLKDIKTGNIYLIESVWWLSSDTNIVKLFLKPYAFNAK